jgi:hypothetical protein
MNEKLARLKSIGFALAGEWELAQKGIVCELQDFANVCNALYAFAVDGELMYVGKTVAKSPLRSRFAGYRNPGTTQSTNVRNNRNIRESLDRGKRVEIYVLPDTGLFYYGGFHLNIAAGMEDSLVRELNPPWNGGQKDVTDDMPEPAASPASELAPPASCEAFTRQTSAGKPSARAGSKYEPLREYLVAEQQETVRMTFSKIEDLVGEPLPDSARKYREWWSNQSNVANRPQARAWTEAGFAVQDVNQSQEWVEFVRREAGRAEPRASVDRPRD